MFKMLKSTFKIITILILIAAYFGIIFSVAYGWRLKKTEPGQYEVWIADIKAKASEVKTSAFAAVEKWKPKEDIPEPIQEVVSPVNEIADASSNTTETYSTTDPETGDTILTGGGTANIVYFNQQDPRWKNTYYGATDPIGSYGCGPTTLAMVVSSLTDERITPDAMSAWAYQNGYFCEGSGSYHSIIPQGASGFGLKVENLGLPTKDILIQRLCTGNVMVALMQKGHFTTSGGHFVILRGTTLDGKILIADPLSQENSMKAWDPEILTNEFKSSANSGGPVWAISK